MRSFLTVSAFLLLAPRAEARYSVADLLKPGHYSADQMTLGMDPALTPLFNKYALALKNPALMSEIMPKLKPGQPMPYDARFGMTEAEYGKLQAGLLAMKVVATGKKADLEILVSGDTYTVKSDACTLLKDGAKIDKSSTLLSLTGYEPVKPNYFENHATDSPMAPFDGFMWRPIHPGKRVELTVGRRTQEQFCLIDCMNVGEGAKEDSLLRFDCVNGPAEKSAQAAAPVAAPAPSAPAPSGGDDVLAGFEKQAASDPAAKTAAPPTARVAPAVAAAPPPSPASQVRVPIKVTDKTPPVICRGSLSRYGYVPPVMYARCKDANEHSAHVVNVYSYIYKGGIDATLLGAMLDVKTQDQEDCAVQIAKQYAGSMTTKYFRDTCL